jgi:hypothetical protein
VRRQADACGLLPTAHFAALRRPVALGVARALGAALRAGGLHDRTARAQVRRLLHPRRRGRRAGPPQRIELGISVSPSLLCKRVGALVRDAGNQPVATCVTAPLICSRPVFDPPFEQRVAGGLVCRWTPESVTPHLILGFKKPPSVHFGTRRVIELTSAARCRPLLPPRGSCARPEARTCARSRPLLSPHLLPCDRCDRRRLDRWEGPLARIGDAACVAAPAARACPQRTRGAAAHCLGAHAVYARQR